MAKITVSKTEDEGSTPSTPANTAHILKKLHELESEHDVKILYACESGSRAWGIESKDSDYDVRFIYIHNDPNWYADLHDHRDVIEWMSDDHLFDFSGWDIRKALKLAYKSNCGIMEWLYGSIRYIETSFDWKLWNLMQGYSAQALMHHYASLAHRQYKAYFNNEGRDVLLKKYFYIIRPICAVLSMHKHDYDLPPVDFMSLAPECFLRNDNEIEDLVELLERKAVGTEATKGRLPHIDIFIKDHMVKVRDLANKAPTGNLKFEDFNNLFLDEWKKL